MAVLTEVPKFQAYDKDHKDNFKDYTNAVWLFQNDKGKWILATAYPVGTGKILTKQDLDEFMP